MLEIGTFSGHSALAMAGGAARRRAHRHLRARPDSTPRSRSATSTAARSASRITLHLGPALETIDRLEGEFDFVFIDANKDGYVDYYEAVLPRLSHRGLIAVDNTLYSGRVLDGDGPISRFNEHVRSDPRAVRVILSVRDGITLIRRR